MDGRWWDDYYDALRELGIEIRVGKHVPSPIHDGEQTRCLVCGLWVKGVDMYEYNCPGRSEA